MNLRFMPADTALELPPLTTIHWLVLFSLLFLAVLAWDNKPTDRKK